MDTLEVPGARLYYETHGSGPPMIMIPGSPGVAEIYRPIMSHLESDHTVVIYDRRGFWRSELDGEQDYKRRIETDTEDVRRLIEHVNSGPAIVFGASSGALIALEVLIHHPSVVRTIVPYEPPAVTELPDGREWLDFFSSLYDLYRESGPQPAMEKFLPRSFADSDRQAITRMPKNEVTLANAKYWFEHELRQYPPTALDLEALTEHADRIVLAAGQDSPGYPCYEVNRVLSEKLGRDLVELPGGHVGYVARAAEFAAALRPHLPNGSGAQCA